MLSVTGSEGSLLSRNATLLRSLMPILLMPRRVLMAIETLGVRRLASASIFSGISRCVIWSWKFCNNHGALQESPLDDLELR